MLYFPEPLFFTARLLHHLNHGANEMAGFYRHLDSS